MNTLAVQPDSTWTGASGRLIRAWRRFRVRTIYLARHGRLPDLDRPRRFTEWVQWRKLEGRDASLDRLTDKLASKAFAESTLSPAAVPPTLWSGTELPASPPGPLPLMVKANHGCSQFIAIRTLEDWNRARAIAPSWLTRSYGEWLDEHAYRSARRLILVEPFLGGSTADLPEDYKVYVFNGRAKLVQHHIARNADHAWTQYDLDWNRIGGARSDAVRPATLERMIEAGEILGRNHDFVRVDFYEVDGQLWFGEFCLFPGSGLDPFTPDSLDEELGAAWAAALQAT